MLARGVLAGPDPGPGDESDRAQKKYPGRDTAPGYRSLTNGFCADENNTIRKDPTGGTNCTVPLQ